ncbi:MAG TPA: glycosyltransferase family 4 protein [Gemmatimonadaceae bacterium]|nr:glycosyltransferase family 4 protein [Gemmatimonadaceae bacterium]
MTLRVLYVYQGDWPRNAVRVRKQTQALAADGFAVRLLAANPNNKSRRERNDWMEIERVPSFGGGRIGAALGFPVFANPLWVWEIWRAARDFRPDCMIVSDLPLAPTVLRVGRALGVPVHYEISDVYPVAFRSNRDAHPSLASRIARNPTVAEALDRGVIRGAASVFVVSEESRARCIAMGASPDAVALVGNTPAQLTDLTTMPALPADLAGWEDRVVVLFLGNLLSDRGLMLSLDAMALAVRAFPKLALAIVGDGPETRPLATRIDELGLGDCVRLLGWKSHEVHDDYYRHAAIGLLAFLSTEHIEITLPNKLFDYMGAALPVVASDVASLRRVVEATGAGVLVPPGNAAALADALVTLARDPARRQALGAAGRAAIEGAYSWEHDRARMLEQIRRSLGDGE